MHNSTELKREQGVKSQFLLTGFTQAAGIRTYAFEGRVGTQRIDCTVEVDLALIPGYRIQIQELPLLCRDLLQQTEQPTESRFMVFTEQQMRSHAGKLALAREEAERRKKHRQLPGATVGTGWSPAG